jgi:hypothetical protein
LQQPCRVMRCGERLELKKEESTSRLSPHFAIA